MMVTKIFMVAVGMVATSEQCTFSIEAGLSSNSTGPKLILGTRKFTPADVMEVEGRLCFFGTSKSRTALLMTANSLAYLWRMWPFVVHKVNWATNHNLRPVLWLGPLPRDLATTVGPECQQSLEFQRKVKPSKTASFYDGRRRDLVSNHHAKIVAAMQLLPLVDGLFYVDLDTVFRAPRLVSIFDVLDDPDVDIVFGSTNFAFWHVKSYIFYLRGRTTLAEKFLTAWLESRCGFKDQYSLWHAILTVAKEAKCIDYHGEVYRNFTYRGLALHTHFALEPYPNLRLTCDDRALDCPSFRFCKPDYDLGHKGEFHHTPIPSKKTRFFRYIGGNVTFQDDTVLLEG